VIRVLPLLQILIVLHAVDGRPIYLNPKTVVRLTQSVDGKNVLVVDSAKCLVSFVDGKFVSVRETCDEVRTRLQERQ
jgi:uncharacterized protein YlzI (FlbEa/FlbD family)